MTEQTTEVVSEVKETVIIEVLTGRPGVQNVYVGTTPPPNPQEGWIWVDTT